MCVLHLSAPDVANTPSRRVASQGHGLLCFCRLLAAADLDGITPSQADRRVVSMQFDRQNGDGYLLRSDRAEAVFDAPLFIRSEIRLHTSEQGDVFGFDRTSVRSDHTPDSSIVAFRGGRRACRL